MTTETDTPTESDTYTETSKPLTLLLLICTALSPLELPALTAADPLEPDPAGTLFDPAFEEPLPEVLPEFELTTTALTTEPSPLLTALFDVPQLHDI